MPSKVIIHVDLDAFFAAVEQRDDPDLKGKPVIIGADPKGGNGRGVVSTCSYEARHYGIRSAMPISMAFKRCPHGIFLRGDHRKYHAVSDEIFDILAQFTPDMEPVSIDEAFLDITKSYHLFGSPYETAQLIKDKIKDEVQLTASIGIAPIKMLAKIASDYCKPDGLLEIKEDNVLSFLWPLTIDKLWGVGPKTNKTLLQMGIRTVGELARIPPEVLHRHFGEHGQHLHDLANGIDLRDVENDEEIKSISHEYTFEEDTDDRSEIEKVLLELSEKVSCRLRKIKLKGRTITVKIRLKGFKTYTRASTFSDRTNHTDVIYKKAKEIFNNFYVPGTQIRLVGVRISHFDNPYIGESLFEDPREIKREQVHKAIDSIKEKFGDEAIHRGRS